MKLSFRNFLVVAMGVSGLFGSDLWAAPSDFAGIWETQDGKADQYSGWGGINFTNCSIRADINTVEDLFSIKSISVKCQEPGQEKFVKVLPREDFTLGDNGKLWGPNGSGKITGQLVQLEQLDPYDGNHYVRAEIRGNALFLLWSYVSEEGFSFDVDGGATGLVRTVTP
ncbi:MAG TPA: hypothetical protein DCS07_05270 [Bdellovibrionales bacterium]|nr:MAG: hypothetical protein A2Z97_03125 [Bdellovibrionales bacterium GWB1_52_6]OFZ06345.1 MAG: hypothetical protein A2X97_02680 [Bdellovibrionales bacterium GWA1_52_35]OFZ36569.1 MAG: hypothetical protein A2070_09505 [Bdellovibrionales bacterium GWC1_52_8]HAR42030.1 hypothetical protein [Bdellovibrionales bacterium]HCM40097.1 hypothetical protein [Bdellovibrionales bacterium]